MTHAQWERPVSACLFASLLSFLAPTSSACSSEAEVEAQEKQHQAYLEWRESLDFSFLEMPYAQCRIDLPTPVLSFPEACYIAKLSARCTVADDCLVQCIAKGMNGKVGGGCWHLCFQAKFKLSEWNEPKAWSECR